MRKRLYAIFAILVLALTGAGLTAGTASAEPTVIVSNGVKITPTLEFP